ncbi:hypothetical protein HR12_28685 [Microbacterium sp. SUBG005]|nr:hypothetical protein HR12_28685 [Microbacterium sp. SUBG005]
MLNLVLATAFQHVQVTYQVCIRVGMRVFQRVTHARLGGKMDHAVKHLISEEVCHALAVR